MTDCIFCDILAGEAPGTFVARGALCAAFMDIQPVNDGHVLVVPLVHAADLASLPPEVGGAMFQMAQRVAAALRVAEGVDCEGVNLFLADGEVAGQEVFHAHLHVLPRYDRDGFGLRFGSSYYDLPERVELEEVCGFIREAMG